jgi:NitT/TauT family transport system permease protein
VPRLRWWPRVNLPGLLFILFVLVLWEIAVDAGWVTFDYLPAPHRIAGALGRLTASGELGADIAHTLAITLIGWVLSAAFGMALGILLGIRRWAWSYSFASLELLRALPPIMLVPAVLLIAGFTSKSEIIVVVYSTVLPVTVYAMSGVRRVTRTHREVARMLALGDRGLITKVIVPGAAPSIIVGLRVGLSISLALTVVSEMIGNPQGLGYAFTYYQQALRVDELFAFILVVGLLGVILNAIFLAVVRVALPGIARSVGEV